MPSYPGAERILEDQAMRDRIDAYAHAYAEVANEAWKGPEYDCGKCALVPFSGYVDMASRFPDRMAKTQEKCCLEPRIEQQNEEETL